MNQPDGTTEHRLTPSHGEPLHQHVCVVCVCVLFEVNYRLAKNTVIHLDSLCGIDDGYFIFK